MLLLLLLTCHLKQAAYYRMQAACIPSVAPALAGLIYRSCTAYCYRVSTVCPVTARVYTVCK